MNTSFQRFAGTLAILAGLLALLSLVIGLAGVDYDFEAFSDPAFLITLGASGAVLIRWSYWLNMVGNYLFLVPLALFLHGWLKSEQSSFAGLFTVSGLLYMALGAAGSAIFAAAWPLLMELYESAPADQQAALVTHFALVNAMAGEGLHGVLQDIVGALWFVGMGALLRARRGALGIVAMAIGGFLVLNTLGNVLGVEALSLIGLTVNILIGPLWSIWLGLVLLRTYVE